MAGDRCYIQTFIFSDNTTQDKAVWESDVRNNNESKFPVKNINGVDEIGVPTFEELPKETFRVGSKMTQEQIRADRMQRSRAHFKKEVWDTIPNSEKQLYRDRSDLKR